MSGFFSYMFSFQDRLILVLWCISVSMWPKSPEVIHWLLYTADLVAPTGQDIQIVACKPSYAGSHWLPEPPVWVELQSWAKRGQPKCLLMPRAANCSVSVSRLAHARELYLWSSGCTVLGNCRIWWVSLGWNQRFVQKACSWPRESAFPATLGEPRRTWLWNGERRSLLFTCSLIQLGADGGEEESNPDLRNAGVFLRLSAKQLLLAVGPEDVPTETLLIRGSHLSPQRQVWAEVVLPRGRLHVPEGSPLLNFSMAITGRAHEPEKQSFTPVG